ncbi:MAG: shikimate kinase [Myxococcaceae bacterium]|nr:shikimate kinase [Myxococcaceae bacterium]
MSTPAWWLELVDPRLRESLTRDVAEAAPCPLRGHVVLVGHRGAGKSRLLLPVAERLRRPAVELDAALGRALFESSQLEFRRAERRAFVAVPGEAVVSAGGGFLSHHGDLLEGHTAVQVPITFETYAERMRADTTRPRLKPNVSLEEEIASVFEEREVLHGRVRTVPLAALLKRLE